MVLNIPQVLKATQLAQVREILEKADWVDGKISAGAQAAPVKQNQEIPKDHPTRAQIGKIILSALGENKLFAMAALPVKISIPSFNRYQGQNSYGPHIDNAIVPILGEGLMRGDISATLFLNSPDEYEGGELSIEDIFGTHQIKLPAGHMVLYSASSLHQVKPVTRGTRIASFFWIQSMIRNDLQRDILLNLELATQTLRQRHPQDPSVNEFLGIYNKLLRQWAEV